MARVLVTKLLLFGGLLLPTVVTDEVSASQYQTVAKRKIGKKHSRKKRRSRQIDEATRNILSPFVLRLLYSPSYRFFTEEHRDEIDEDSDKDVTLKVAQFFPIATGIEGQFSFNNLLSLAVGGSFSYHGQVASFEVDDSKTANEEIEHDLSYYEFTVDSSLYVNANYFLLGPGIGLTFANLLSDYSLTEKGKKFEASGKASWKRVSANFSLRRDFFSAQGLGVGIGLTASIYLTNMFSIRVEVKNCVYDGKDCKTEVEDDLDDTDDLDDDDAHGVYSAMLMPMIYLVF